MGRALTLLLSLLSAVTAVNGEAGSRLVAVYAIHRHGSRNVLAKTSYLSEAVQPLGDVTLLPLGQRQCYNTGAAFLSRYISPTTCSNTSTSLLAPRASQPNNTCLAPAGSPRTTYYGTVGDPGVTWNNYNVLVTSSALDRTLQSAQYFLAGVFQEPNNATSTLYIPTGAMMVPVYSAAASDADDVLIRAYAKCPTFNAALAQWYAGAPFQAMAAATSSFRAYVAGLPGFGAGVISALKLSASAPGGTGEPFGLQNWYNVWDRFNTFVVTGGQYGDVMPDAAAMRPVADPSAIVLPGTPGPAVGVPSATSPPSLMGQIAWLMNWLETSKMASDLVGPMNGAPLLSDMAARFATAAGASAAAPVGAAAPAQYPRMMVISSHYNTQLSVLAALKLDVLLSPADAATVPWLTLPGANVVGVIPPTSAVLVFELHQSAVNTSSFAVRAVLQNGPAQPYQTVPLPCASAAGVALGGTGACTLADFQALMQPAIAAAGSPAAWCQACRATAPMACRAAAYTALTTPPPAAAVASGAAGWRGLGSVAAVAMGTAAAALIVLP